MNKQIRDLILLSKQNPNVEIITMTSSDVICNDDYSYWAGTISRVICDWIYEYDDGAFIGKDDIEEILSERIEDEYGWETDRLEKEVEKEFVSLINSKEIKRKIIIYIEV